MVFFAALNRAAFYIAAFATALIVYVFAFLRHRLGKTQNSLFRALALDIMLSSAFIILRVYAEEYLRAPVSENKLAALGHFGYFITHTMLAPLFCYYMIAVVDDLHRENKIKNTLILIPFVISEVLVLGNPVTNWVYYYEAGQLQRNWGEMIIYVVGVFYFAVGIVTVLFNWNGMNKKRRSSLIFFQMITISGVLVQLFFSKIKIELLAEAIGLMGLMLSIENEDEWIEIGTFVYNRKALFADIERRLKKNANGYLLCVRRLSADSRYRGGAGANLIRSVANALKEVHPWYNIYRITPTAFMLHLRESDADIARGLAETVINRLEEGVTVGKEKIHVEASIIMAKYPEEIRSLVGLALMGDAVLPPADDGVRIYEGEKLGSVFRQAIVEDAIRRGLNEGTFEVYYQPVHKTGGLELYAAEALIRLHDTQMGDLYPDEFIPIAESTGLINEMGEFVVREVCRFLKSGTPDSLGMDHINVNLSVVQCIQNDFVQNLRTIVDEYGIDPGKINFEITESVAANDYKMLESVITDFKNSGFRFSMDDYGTGYSNMQSIFLLDFDVIKIDKSILWEAEKTEGGRIILENSIKMIRKTGKRILVEGVETDKHAKLLDELGVDYLQGYLFSKPVPEKDFVALYA